MPARHVPQCRICTFPARGQCRRLHHAPLQAAPGTSPRARGTASRPQHFRCSLDEGEEPDGGSAFRLPAEAALRAGRARRGSVSVSRQPLLVPPPGRKESCRAGAPGLAFSQTAHKAAAPAPRRMWRWRQWQAPRPREP